MRILCPPVVVGDRICRIVSPIESLLEVEEWVGTWWEPSSVTLTTASLAPAAPVTLLQERGVPDEDRTPGPRSGEDEIQALMHTHGAPTAQPLMPNPAHAQGPGGVRRKVFSGNSRFRRGRASAPTSVTRPESRVDERVGEWTGPFRRATDEQPSRDPSAP